MKRVLIMIITIILSFIIIIPNSHAEDGAVCYYKVNTGLGCNLLVTANASGITLEKNGTCTLYNFINGQLTKGNFKNNDGKWECRDVLVYKYTMSGRISVLEFGYQLSTIYNVLAPLDTAKSKATNSLSSNENETSDPTKTCIYTIANNSSIAITFNSTMIEIESTGVEISAKYFTASDMMKENDGECPASIDYKISNGYAALCLENNNTNDQNNNCKSINQKEELTKEGATTTDTDTSGGAQKLMGKWGQYTSTYDSVCSFCYEASTAIKIIGFVILVLKIVIPIIIISLGSLDMAKAVLVNDDNQLSKSVNNLVRRIITGIIIFFIPTIFNIIFGIVEGFDSVSNEFSVCKECLFNPASDTCSNYTYKNCDAVLVTEYSTTEYADEKSNAKKPNRTGDGTYTDPVEYAEEIDDTDNVINDFTPSSKTVGKGGTEACEGMSSSSKNSSTTCKPTGNPYSGSGIKTIDAVKSNRNNIIDPNIWLTSCSSCNVRDTDSNGNGKCPTVNADAMFPGGKKLTGEQTVKWDGTVVNCQNFYIAEDSIKWFTYLSSVQYRENGGFLKSSSYDEAIKAHLILIKTYTLYRGKWDENNLAMAGDGCCAQVFRLQEFDTATKAKYERLYNEVKNYILVQPSGKLYASYGAERMKSVGNYSSKGLNYKQLLNKMPSISSGYSSGAYIYDYVNDKVISIA